MFGCSTHTNLFDVHTNAHRNKSIGGIAGLRCGVYARGSVGYSAGCWVGGLVRAVTVHTCNHGRTFMCTRCLLHRIEQRNQTLGGIGRQFASEAVSKADAAFGHHLS